MNRRDEELGTQDIAAARRDEDVRDEDVRLEGQGETNPAPDEAIRLEETEMEPEPEAEPEARPLIDEDSRGGFLDRWKAVQTMFVDEPRGAVQQADGLVAEVMRHLAEVFADSRKDLEAQWDRGGDVSTEDLRLALQRYRAFFNRLLET
jgi:hypothetical protein